MPTVTTQYSQIVKTLKSQILGSRYRAATLVNQEMLALYFSVGQTISEKTKTEKWGTHVLETISQDLQNELPGLRGFSASNLKYMRLFFEAWSPYNLIRELATDELKVIDYQNITFSSLVTDDLISYFLQVSFTHHNQILAKTQTLEQRLFYIQKVVQNFWSVDTLKHFTKQLTNYPKNTKGHYQMLKH